MSEIRHEVLRARIATAIARADGDIEPDTWDHRLADAVIQELENILQELEQKDEGA